eukprot:Gb_00710 [translate_table: standard]
MMAPILENSQGIDHNGNGITCSTPFHIVLFAFPLQGHIIPMVHLASKLASKGLIVTFVNTEACHAHMTRAQKGNQDPFFHARSLGLDIRSAQVSDGLPLAFDRSLKHDEFMQSLVVNMRMPVEELLHDLNRKGPPVSCIVADTFYVWTDRVAKKFQVPHVSFWTEPTVVFSIYYHWDLLAKNGHHPFKDHATQDLINYIPGISTLRVTDLPSYLQESDVSTIVHSVIYSVFQSVRGADLVICNTVHELESQAISEMQAIVPFWAVGPLLPGSYLEGQSHRDEKIGTSLLTEYDCSEWLDSKARGSVLYISFGSYAHASKAQIEEMAMGLLESKHPFIWVLRPDIVSADVPDFLPHGFLERINNQGLVVHWLSQMQVLSHPSVGGFLTHCGWNSILESIWLGVPMLAFPLLTDQYTNCRLIVDEWRVAIKLGEAKRSVNNCRALVKREEIAATVKEFMEGEAMKKVRLRIESVREIVRKASIQGGSSDKNLDSLIDDLKARADRKLE